MLKKSSKLYRLLEQIFNERGISPIVEIGKSFESSTSFSSFKYTPFGANLGSTNLVSLVCIGNPITTGELMEYIIENMLADAEAFSGN